MIKQPKQPRQANATHNHNRTQQAKIIDY